ncbi:hypothetical protein ACP0HM_31195 [Escherichia coli]
MNTNEAEIKIKRGGAVSFIFLMRKHCILLFLVGIFIMDDLKSKKIRKHGYGIKIAIVKIKKCGS